MGRHLYLSPCKLVQIVSREVDLVVDLQRSYSHILLPLVH
jgi:hypothetical protein